MRVLCLFGWLSSLAFFYLWQVQKHSYVRLWHSKREVVPVIIKPEDKGGSVEQEITEISKRFFDEHGCLRDVYKN